VLDAVPRLMKRRDDFGRVLAAARFERQLNRRLSE
jgi:hypothetical protein